MPGRFDTPAGWIEACPRVCLSNDLVTANTSVAWVRTVNPITLITIFVYAQMRIAALGVQTVGSVIAYLMTEILAFAVPRAKQLNQAAADARVLADVRAYFPLDARGYVLADLNARRAAVQAANAGNLPAVVNWVAATAADKAIAVPDVDAAWLICRILAECKYPDGRQAITTTIYTTFLAALAKMGNVTDAFLDKVADGVQADLGVHLDRNIFNLDVVRTVWNTISEFTNEITIGAAVTRWIGTPAIPAVGPAIAVPAVQGFIPEYAMRLRLMAQQLPGEGLTALSTIKKAMALAPGFDWAQIMALFPLETTAIQQAIAAVGQNQFYGYVHDKSVIKSTRYKNIAWVAKELLIRLGGNHSLRGYRGWTRSPMYQTQLETIINNYINNPPLPAAVPAANVHALSTSFMQATGIVSD